MFATLIGSLLALSLTVTKVVDVVRNALDPAGNAPKVTWNIVALVVGLAFTLGWGINVAGQALALVPALAGNTRLDGVAGQVLTGFAIGGGAGFFHEILDSLSGIAKRSRAA